MLGKRVHIAAGLRPSPYWKCIVYSWKNMRGTVTYKSSWVSRPAGVNPFSPLTGRRVWEGDKSSRLIASHACHLPRLAVQ